MFTANGDTAIGRIELSSLTHISTGLRVALFSDPESAAMAGDLAMRVGDWSEININGVISDDWKSKVKQMRQLWGSAGLVYGPLTWNGVGIWCAPEPIKKMN